MSVKLPEITEFIARCPNCGFAFHRGVSSSYLAECDCGEKFIVPKFEAGREHTGNE